MVCAVKGAEAGTEGEGCATEAGATETRSIDVRGEGMVKTPEELEESQ
jgi:hypothetical protein